MIIQQSLHILKHATGRILSRPPLPNYAVFMITKRCNMTCAMCGVKRESGRNDMGLEGYRKLFETGLGQQDVVKITGGEPFIRKDSPELIKFLLERSRPNIFHITTNGYFTERIRSFLDGIGGRAVSFSISIDGTREIHNRIRGLPDAFEHAAETVRMIRSRFTNARLTVNCTLSSHNYKEIDEIDKSLKKLAGNRVVYFIADANRSYDDPDNLKQLPLYSEKIQGKSVSEDQSRLYSFVKHNNRNHGWTYRLLNQYYLAGLHRRLEQGPSAVRHRCMALWSYFRMEPNGDIIMCLTKPKAIGNIGESGFKNIWFGPQANKLRGQVRTCRDCWKECEVSPSCVYSSDLLRFLFFRR